jgi:Protein of unknown function (DUF3631)
MTTEQLLLGLNRLDESPWSTIRKGEPLDSRGLAHRLSKYGIASKQHVRERGLRLHIGSVRRRLVPVRPQTIRYIRYRRYRRTRRWSRCSGCSR